MSQPTMLVIVLKIRLKKHEKLWFAEFAGTKVSLVNSFLVMLPSRINNEILG